MGNRQNGVNRLLSGQFAFMLGLNARGPLRVQFSCLSVRAYYIIMPSRRNVMPRCLKKHAKAAILKSNSGSLSRLRRNQLY